MAVDDSTVDWDAAAWIDEDGVADLNLVNVDFAYAVGSADGYCLREKVHQIVDCMPSARDRHTFQNLSHEHEEQNHQRGEKFADGRGRNDGDGHGELHRHASGE